GTVATVTWRASRSCAIFCCSFRSWASNEPSESLRRLSRAARRSSDVWPRGAAVVDPGVAGEPPAAVGGEFPVAADGAAAATDCAAAGADREAAGTDCAATGVDASLAGRGDFAGPAVEVDCEPSCAAGDSGCAGLDAHPPMLAASAQAA